MVDSPHNQEHDSHDGKGEGEDDKGGGCETFDHDGFLPEIRLQFYGGGGYECLVEQAAAIKMSGRTAIAIASCPMNATAVGSAGKNETNRASATGLSLKQRSLSTYKT